jgi:energy-coupling factor transporter ATP-binding protein EcfA2
VVGVAWDRRTAQLALVASGVEAEAQFDADAWRQLLFAASGLRHHLGGDSPAGFRSPLVLAVVDESGEERLRTLAEELTADYAVFDRVDLNFVRLKDFQSPDALDTALAPLLPVCRRVLGGTISREDVQRFWEQLRRNIREAADGLDPLFGDLRSGVAEDLADELIGDHDRSSDRPPPEPVSHLRLHNFRSFVEADVPFGHINVIYGANGSGKSSVLEGLELLWANSSLRRPPGVTASEYQQHLPRGGDGAFEVSGTTNDGRPITVADIADQPQSDLARCVLTQEGISSLVDSPPAERYASLLAVTGLEVPELEPRTKTLVDAAKRDADKALRDAGIKPLPRADTASIRHLHAALSRQFLAKVPGLEEVTVAETRLARAATSSYRPGEWMSNEDIEEVLRKAAEAIDSIRENLNDPPDVTGSLDNVINQIKRITTPIRERASNLETLNRAILQSESSQRVARPIPEEPSALPPSVAARWLNHADALATASQQFQAEANQLKDPDWKRRLGSYADSLKALSQTTPRAELERLARRPITSQPPPAREIDPQRWTDAAFEGAPANLTELRPLIAEVHAHLANRVDALETIVEELERHPARSYFSHSSRVVGALCRFELARVIRRQGPIAQASEQLLSELLQGKLYPVVRELVAAIVRFEWYFEPLRITVEGQELLIGGLATPRSDLDARLLLNSAERTVVGVAWFLALHLLQPKDRRRVLIIDDAASGFDSVNRAGFGATLRSFIRIVRPEQVVLATHDEAVATLLFEELSPVDDWPREITKIKCSRDKSDASTTAVRERDSKAHDLSVDEAMLGLGGAPSLFGT